MKLRERDRRFLALLGSDARTVRALSTDLDASPGELRERLTELADNGLVYDLGDDAYRRTESGRRVLVTSPTWTADNRIDTSPEVERVLEEFDLDPEEAEAIRGAFAFLRYWGRVTEEEVADAIYSEDPAGRTNPTEWWDDLVREPLAALPGVAAPTGSDGDDPWRYEGPAESDELGSDGRRVLSRTHPVYGDVKHALESLDLSDAEREAARAAFRFLYRRDGATEAEIRDAVYADHDADYPSAQALWESVVEEALEALPGVEREGERWRYRRP